MYTDHLASAVIKLDVQFRVDYLNVAAETLFELSAHKAHGLSIDVLMQTPEQSTHLVNAIRHAVTSNQPFTCREAILRVGLHDKVIDYTVLPFLDQGSGQIAVLIEIQPVERLMSLAKEEQLNRQHQLARKIVRGVAHEIKNPLAGIRGATQLLERALPTSEHTEFTKIIIKEVDRLKQLVDAMLGSQGMFKLQSTNIHEPLEHVRLLLLTQADIPIVIERDYDLSLPELPADQHQLIQVLLNIGVNALEAFKSQQQAQTQLGRRYQPKLIFKTRVHPMMTIHGIKHRSVIRVDIIDNGGGIAADILPSVFYPMMTGRANGTGLGLSIAQDIVHKHQGLITCESVVGRTQFSLFLPWKTIA